MLNLLRMDIRRLFRSKSLYICLIIMCATTIFTFGFMFLMCSPAIMKMAIENNWAIAIIYEDPSDMAAITGSDFLTLFHQTNISGGMLPLTTAILAALFVCVEFDGGFIKNIMASHENKWDYILSKVISFGLVNLLYLVVTIALDGLMNLAAGSLFTFNPLPDTLFYLFSVWMIVNAFCALILLIVMLSRSVAAGVAGSIFLCSGAVVMIVNSILGIFKANGIMNYTLYMNLALCPMKYNGAGDLRALAVGAAFLVIYTVLSKLVLSRRDI